MFFIQFKRIIQRMLDFYRRVWQAFFIGSPALAGVAYLFKDCHIAFIILLILASIFFIVALLGLYLDYRYTHKEEYDKKHPPKSTFTFK